MRRRTQNITPDWLGNAEWSPREYDSQDVKAALAAESHGPKELAALLSPAAEPFIEEMAVRARDLTRRHFGRTMQLYAPLYLSNYCSSGCAYCGYASDRVQERRKLSFAEVRSELAAIRRMGIREILLLTGDRTAGADFDYVARCVEIAAGMFPFVGVEVFPMTAAEYRALAAAGCSGVTVYQETYDPVAYDRLHRWGTKKDYGNRIETPERILEAGIRWLGMGFLLGLADPVVDSLCLFRHIQYLRGKYWRSGVSLSFPRICVEQGGFRAPHPVDDRYLARLVWAFRICMPDVPLVLSTRERAAFRDGMAGVGISKMSVASRTSVGGYAGGSRDGNGQFIVNDGRSVRVFSAALRKAGLEPVFKNWDAAFRQERG